MRGIRATHTYAELEISPAAYDEIAAKLRDADYRHVFVDDAIDMHGIGLVRAAVPPLQPGPPPPPNRMVETSEETASMVRSIVVVGGLICALLMMLGGYMVSRDVRAADRAEISEARKIITEELGRMR